jgi:hypothetical protein
MQNSAAFSDNRSPKRERGRTKLQVGFLPNRGSVPMLMHLHIGSGASVPEPPKEFGHLQSVLK